MAFKNNKEVNKVLKEEETLEAKDVFLQSLNLMGHELIKKESDKKDLRTPTRPRRNVSRKNPKYDDFVDTEALMSAKRSSKRKSNNSIIVIGSSVDIVDKKNTLKTTTTTISESPRTSKRIYLSSAAKICCICKKKDFDITCETCKANFHADCIRVSGSDSAPIPEKLLICPKCVKSEAGQTAIDDYLKNKANGEVISSKIPKKEKKESAPATTKPAPAAKSSKTPKPIKLEKGEIVRTNRKNTSTSSTTPIANKKIKMTERVEKPEKPRKESMFPHRKNEVCINSSNLHHHHHDNSLNARSQVMVEKPLSKEELEKTIISMNFAAKAVLKKEKDKIKCNVQDVDIKMNIKLQEIISLHPAMDKAKIKSPKIKIKSPNIKIKSPNAKIKSPQIFARKSQPPQIMSPSKSSGKKVKKLNKELSIKGTPNAASTIGVSKEESENRPPIPKYSYQSKFKSKENSSPTKPENEKSVYDFDEESEEEEHDPSAIKMDENMDMDITTNQNDSEDVSMEELAQEEEEYHNEEPIEDEDPEEKKKVVEEGLMLYAELCDLNERSKKLKMQLARQQAMNKETLIEKQKLNESVNRIKTNSAKVYKINITSNKIIAKNMISVANSMQNDEDKDTLYPQPYSCEIII